MRIIFFGMLGQFSLFPLEMLLAAGAEVGAVVLPSSQRQASSLPRRLEPDPAPLSDLPLLGPYLNPNIIHTAWRHNIPVWEVAKLTTQESMTLLSDLQPDLIVVACFPYIFPPSLLQLPQHGCLNLHPSLLPAYRGPSPLFWIAHQDEHVTGVTLHFLDKGFDSGDIVAQTHFERPDGLSYAALERRCAEIGAKLLLTTLQQLEAGSVVRHSQQESQASYFPQPSPADFIIPTTWPARRAFNFLRGAEAWPLLIDVGPAQYSIRVAKSYTLDQTLDQPFLILGDELWVQFQPGVLRAKIHPHPFEKLGD